MTQDEIIEMAKQAGCFEKYQVFYFAWPDLERFAKLVTQHAKAEEREACANAISKIQMTPTLTHGVLVKLPDVVNAIRARGQA